jgi:aspartate/methionine/tyrosine aminotransferase
MATTSSLARHFSRANAAALWRHDPAVLSSSNMTKLQRELEGSDRMIDLTYGYPDGLQQPWMRALTRIPARRLELSNARQLKQEIASWFAARYSQAEAQVLLTNTATEALAVVMGCVVEEAGDEIILFDGCFDPYPALIHTFKGRPVFAARFEDGAPDLYSLQRLVTSRTRAVLITNPDNPLGYIYSQREIEILKDLCSAHGLTLVVDSAFAFVSPYGAGTFGPMEALRNDERCILIGDTGKIFDLYGVRCGTLIASGALAERLQKRLDQLFFRMDLLRLNVLASVVCNEQWAQAAQHVNETVAANYAYLSGFLHPGLRPVQPMAGSLALLEFGGRELTDVELAAAFRRSAGVAMVPCSYFVFANACGNSLRNRLRIALARPPKIIRRAVENLNRAMDAGLCTS